MARFSLHFQWFLTKSMAPQSPDDKIPVYELSDIGRALADQLTAMGYSCDFVVRAPGRVNLIGMLISLPV